MLRKTVLIPSLIFLITSQYGCVTDKHKYRAYQDMKDFVLDGYNRSGKPCVEKKV